MRLRPRRLAAIGMLVAGLAGASAASPTTPAADPSPGGPPECPRSLACALAAAAYANNAPDDPADYGNYDLADRPGDGLDIRFIVIHDTEYGHDPAVALFQDPRSKVSAHYLVRSSDGAVTQLVRTRDVAWHAGNWWVNTHAVGIEIEGYALAGRTWYGDAVYRSVARLVRFLARRHDIPLDRGHVIGHDEVPGSTAATQAGMHWDPGPFFDWDRLMQLAGALDTSRRSADDGGADALTIAPRFQDDGPTLTACDTSPCRALGQQPANIVQLRTGPDRAAPLIADQLLAGTPLEPAGVGTTRADDWGDTAVAGRSFAVAERAGDWTAIWFGGQKAWFENPGGETTTRARWALVSPRRGLASIPVYGRAYPEAVSAAPLGYTIAAGQSYVAYDRVGADYYEANTFGAPETYRVLTGPSQFYEISFNHRLAFVRAADVEHVGR